MKGKSADQRFGERVRLERKHRGWTQPKLAEMLEAKGIKPMQEVIISKIESGERPARIIEAAGIAECFGLSVDALLGHGTDRRDNRAYALRSLRITADRSAHQIRDIANTLAERLSDLYGTGLTLEEWPAEGWRAWNAMGEATSALLELAQEKSE